MIEMPNKTTNNLIYDIHDRPRTIRELFFYALQQMMSVFVATVLIATICGTPVSSCLFGAGAATIIYQLITRRSSPMFISSCGATCSAVIGALALSADGSYLPVMIGGLVILLVYALFALVVAKNGIAAFNRIFPAIIVGPTTMVIGLNLASFIPSYVQVNGSDSVYGVIVALITMLTVAFCSHYFKGFLKTIPFLIGLAVGYIVSVIFTLFNVENLIDFSTLNFDKVFALPEFVFLKNNTLALDWSTVANVLVLFVPVSVCALLEHYSDHKVLSNIIGTDLTVTPGLHRTLIGDGVASFAGTVLCGLPNTSYGESIATTGFSRVASVRVITTAALMLILMSFMQPVQAFIRSVPSCVFGGCAMILYGYIAVSGLRTLINAAPDLNDNKNLIVISVILTVGVSGIYLFSASFTGVSLAMVLGVILNLTLRNKE